MELLKLDLSFWEKTGQGTECLNCEARYWTNPFWIPRSVLVSSIRPGIKDTTQFPRYVLDSRLHPSFKDTSWIHESVLVSRIRPGFQDTALFKLSVLVSMIRPGLQDSSWFPVRPDFQDLSSFLRAIEIWNWVEW